MVNDKRDEDEKASDSFGLTRDGGPDLGPDNNLWDVQFADVMTVYTVGDGERILNRSMAASLGAAAAETSFGSFGHPGGFNSRGI
jgi:hypothetical protein